MVGVGVPLGQFQHLTVGGRITNHPFFAYLLAAGFKLRFDKANPAGAFRTDCIRHREYMFEGDKRNVHTEKLIGSARSSSVTLRILVRSRFTTRGSVRKLQAS